MTKEEEAKEALDELLYSVQTKAYILDYNRGYEAGSAK